MASYVALWILVAMLTVRTIQVARSSRPASQGLAKQDHGLELGKPFPITSMRTLQGHEVRLQQETGVVVLFTSVSCPACQDLHAALVRYRRKRPDLQIMLFMLGDELGVRDTVDQYGLDLPVSVLRHGDVERFGTRIFPFGYRLSPTGDVVSKGVVNGEVHLDLLLRADPLAPTPSLESGYFNKKRG